MEGDAADLMEVAMPSFLQLSGRVVASKHAVPGGLVSIGLCMCTTLLTAPVAKAQTQDRGGPSIGQIMKRDVLIGQAAIRACDYDKWRLAADDFDRRRSELREYAARIEAAE